MPHIEFSSHLALHVDCPAMEIEAIGLRSALEKVFENNPKLRGYVLDDQSHVRQHVAIFVDGKLIRDRVNWDLKLNPGSKVHVMQALSGG